MTSTQSGQSKVKLNCTDGSSAEIELSLARISPLLRKILDDPGRDVSQPIAIHDSKVTGEALDIVFYQWCCAHQEDQLPDQQDDETFTMEYLQQYKNLEFLFKRGRRHPRRGRGNDRNVRISESDRQMFARLDNSTLYSVIIAAYYLHIGRLVNIKHVPKQTAKDVGRD